eukprot:TRINITY_DN6947_c0_g2_i1.p1 TRINITY_DN6947_c0_g2~~TRINITY_DN6947_c0_g2_i1.p1  ORF type:complete len:190 (+),score=39.48 TRINITY_DN6947_c0_g2_i1:68-637(+)
MENNEKNNKLKIAVNKNEEKTVLALLKQNADPNIKFNKPEKTLLYVASGNNNISIVKHLIEYKANVNMISVNGETALSRATYWGFIELIKLLVRNGADINQKDNNGLSNMDFILTKAPNNYRSEMLKAVDEGVTLRLRGNWSVDDHHLFKPNFQNLIFLLVMIHKHNIFIKKIPKFVFYIILNFVSCNI